MFRLKFETGRSGWSALTLATLLLCACGTPKPPPQNPPPREQPANTTEPAPGGETPEASGAPANVPIGQLAPDAATEVRVAGVVAQIVGMRLVPAKLIFKVRDTTGTVTAVINEKADLTEGQKIEIVGHYKAIPSPMHTGPGEAPEEPVFVVDRFITF